MLQIAIIEDEADLAQQTKDNVVRYLNEHGLEGNIAVFNDGMDIAENYKPIWDILLLDIEMPLLDGMSAAQKIREQDATVVMIFITRMAKYAIKGYEVDALDFILKPITYAQLSMKLPRAIERASQRQKHHLYLKIEDMKGLAYDDPKWNDFLEQIPVSEMVNLVSNGGWATQEVPSVGKLGYTEVDGPNGINNIMAGSTGNQFCAQSVLACSWNTELAYDMGETFAQEAVAMKIAALYAPAMNIHRSPFSGRNYEYYSEDGLHSGKMAAAETQGIQSQGVTTYCKHFAVNDQESNRDSGGLLTWVNEQAMREIYIKPFEIAVKEGGTRGIMSSFNRIGEICAAENADLLTTVLRNEWGFRGTVITDCILQLSYINIDRAIAAGNDLILSLMNMQAPSEAVTNSPAGHQVLRTATHNILYTSANSIGQEVSAIPVPYWLYITVAVVDAGLIALCVFYFVRRRKNVKRWKEQNSVQA